MSPLNKAVAEKIDHLIMGQDRLFASKVGMSEKQRDIIIIIIPLTDLTLFWCDGFSDR